MIVLIVILAIIAIVGFAITTALRKSCNNPEDKWERDFRRKLGTRAGLHHRRLPCHFRYRHDCQRRQDHRPDRGWRG